MIGYFPRKVEKLQKKEIAEGRRIRSAEPGPFAFNMQSLIGCWACYFQAPGRLFASTIVEGLILHSPSNQCLVSPLGA